MSWIAGIWGKIAAGGVVLLAVLVAVARFLSGVKKAGYDKKEAEDAKAREAHLQRIQDAKRAGDVVRTDPDSVYNDPRNRSRTEGNGHP